MPVPPSPSLIVTVSLATRVRRTKNEGVTEGRTPQSEVGTTLVRRTNLNASVALTGAASYTTSRTRNEKNINVTALAADTRPD